MNSKEQNVVLLGDSVFDNASYVPGDLPVADQLRARLPEDWRVSLLALDGAITEEVVTQLDDLPNDASFLVVSMGGNDALQHVDLFGKEIDTVGGGILEMHDIQNEFSAKYELTLSALLERQIPMFVCSIYDQIPFPDELMRQLAQTSLSIFNDAIFRSAALGGVSILDLRAVCTDESHFAESSPIEPSVLGGEKIAQAIARIVTEEELESGVSRVFVE